MGAGWKGGAGGKRGAGWKGGGGANEHIRYFMYDVVMKEH